MSPSPPSIQVTPQFKLSRPLRKVTRHAVRSYTSGMTEMTPSCPAQRELLCLARTTNGPEIAVTGYGHQREGECAIFIHSQTRQRKVTSASMLLKSVVPESHVYISVKAWWTPFDLRDTKTLFLTRTLTADQLTEVTMDGRPHSVLRSLLLCSRPCLSMLLSNTSTPNTLGFIGLGYFCIAALVTVSQGWLFEEKKKKETVTLELYYNIGDLLTNSGNLIIYCNYVCDFHYKIDFFQSSFQFLQKKIFRNLKTSYAITV